MPVTTLHDWGYRRLFQKKKGRGTALARSNLNWGLPTGHKPYSTSPAIVVIDTDDEEAEKVVAERCPETPVKQKTGSGGWHRIYRRPEKSQMDYVLSDPAEDRDRWSNLQHRQFVAIMVTSSPRFNSSQDRPAL